MEINAITIWKLVGQVLVAQELNKVQIRALGNLLSTKHMAATIVDLNDIEGTFPKRYGNGKLIHKSQRDEWINILTN